MPDAQGSGWGGAAGSAFAAAAPIIGDLINNNQQETLQGRQFTNDKQLAAYQNDLNMQSWMQQQQYNSPAQQMARYKAAGLNPNLIYGQGNNGNASSPVELSAGTSRQAFAPKFNSVAKVGAVASDYLTMRSQIKQQQLLDEQIEGQRAENKIKLNDVDISTDRSVQSAYQTYGDQIGNWSGGGKNMRSGLWSAKYSDFNSPYYYQQSIKSTDLDKKMLDLRLTKQFAEQERSLDLERARRENELEKYTNDPTWYYGERAVNKLLQLVPSIPKFRQGGGMPSDSKMTDHLRGRGFSVRKFTGY